MDETLLQKRLLELASKSDREGIYTYVGFLSLAEQDTFLRMVPQIGPAWQLFGGREDCERQMLRFGSEAAFGYDEPFPICCLQISPKSQKFADKLSHRDFLGALMNLGIDRSLLGDIIIRENEAFLFAQERICNFLQQELHQVKHTAVTVQKTEEIPEGALCQLKEQRLLVSSPRLDGVIAHLFRLSRGDVLELIQHGAVFINSRTATSASALLKEGDIVSVRRHGRFRYAGEEGNSKKGRLYIKILLYV